MLSPTPVRRIGTLSTVLANGALYAAHYAGLQTPASALLLAGSFFRVLTLPLTIYGDQSLHRVAAAMPELHDARKDYLAIVDHPDAISWEKRVAAQKLKNDRDRIFRTHRTNNVKLVVPHLVGMAASLYCLGVPAQQLGSFFLQDAGMAIVSPLAVALARTDAAVELVSASTLASTTGAAVLFTVDPTMALAAGLTCLNVCQHLRLRRGFNAQLDRWIGTSRHVAIAAAGVVAAGSLLSGPLAYLCSVPALSFFPPYLAPVWLGMSLTTAVKVALVHHTGPGQAICRLSPYPPQHGTYGEESTAASHEYRLAFTGVDREETQHIWQTQKRILDYECDVRIHRWLRRIGLFDDLDELAMEAEKLSKKRAVARERRVAREEQEKREQMQREQQQGGSAETAVGAAQPQDGLTNAARRRHEIRENGYKGLRRENPITIGKDGATQEEMENDADLLQRREMERRHALREARKAAYASSSQK